MNDKKNHGLTPENLLRTLPEALKNDESMAALAQSIAVVLADRPEEIQNLLIYSRIDQLPEALLDILARDFKVDWWDGDYTLEEKRRTLKDSWRVRRMLGTKTAVETAISAIYPETTVIEWWEYGGAPYHFRLRIDVSSKSDINSKRHQRVLERVRFYKNLRSHLDSIIYIQRAEGAAECYAASAFAGGRMVIDVTVKVNAEIKPPNIPFLMNCGGRLAGTYTHICTEVST